MRREVWHLTEGLIFAHFAVFFLLTATEGAWQVVQFPWLCGLKMYGLDWDSCQKSGMRDHAGGTFSPRSMKHAGRLCLVIRSSTRIDIDFGI